MLLDKNPILPLYKRLSKAVAGSSEKEILLDWWMWMKKMLQ
jgi:hypothetical protein